MPDFISLTLILTICKILGGVSFISGAIIGVYKVINWVKTKLSSIDLNVVELKQSMDTHITGLRDDVKAQTNALTTELREQRSDFRTFYAPSLLQMMSANQPVPVPVRAKQTVNKKAPARKKKLDKR